MEKIKERNVATAKEQSVSVYKQKGTTESSAIQE